MKKYIFTALAVSALALPAVAFAGKDPTGGVLRTFGTGQVRIEGRGATIKNDSGEYGGVYSKNGAKKSRLDQVKFKFQTDGTVSTSNPDCKVFFGPGVWDNWAAFAADNPSYRVAKKDIPFIIADVQGTYHVYNFQFG